MDVKDENGPGRVTNKRAGPKQARLRPVWGLAAPLILYFLHAIIEDFRKKCFAKLTNFQKFCLRRKSINF